MSPHGALASQLLGSEPASQPGQVGYDAYLEFEADLARARTREGMAVAKAKGRLRGKQPKLSRNREALLVQLWRDGKHTSLELAELFEVGRSTVYRAIERAGEPPTGQEPAETLASQAS